jgi:hypothetical protein
LDQKYLKNAKELSGTAGVNLAVFKSELKIGGRNLLIVPESITSVNLAANLIIERTEAWYRRACHRDRRASFYN